MDTILFFIYRTSSAFFQRQIFLSTIFYLNLETSNKQFRFIKWTIKST